MLAEMQIFFWQNVFSIKLIYLPGAEPISFPIRLFFEGVLKPLKEHSIVCAFVASNKLHF